jgi:hypothetical protein
MIARRTTFWIIGCLLVTVTLAYLVRDTSAVCPSDMDRSECGGYQAGRSGASWLMIADGIIAMIAGAWVIRHRAVRRCRKCRSANPARSVYCEQCGAHLPA